MNEQVHLRACMEAAGKCLDKAAGPLEAMHRMVCELKAITGEAAQSLTWNKQAQSSAPVQDAAVAEQLEQRVSGEFLLLLRTVESHMSHVRDHLEALRKGSLSRKISCLQQAAQTTSW